MDAKLADSPTAQARTMLPSLARRLRVLKESGVLGYAIGSSSGGALWFWQPAALGRCKPEQEDRRSHEVLCFCLLHAHGFRELSFHMRSQIKS